MRKIVLIPIAVILLGAAGCLLGFRAFTWHLMHGSNYNDGRVSMTLDRHWVPRHLEDGRIAIQRPDNFSTSPISRDSMMIRQTSDCTSQDMEAAYTKALQIAAERHLRQPHAIIHLAKAPVTIDCAQMTTSEGITDCFVPRDGTTVRILAEGEALQEAITMMKSIRLTTPCVASNKQ